MTSEPLPARVSAEQEQHMTKTRWILTFQGKREEFYGRGSLMLAVNAGIRIREKHGLPVLTPEIQASREELINGVWVRRPPRELPLPPRRV
jgi:hypothetical protein